MSPEELRAYATAWESELEAILQWWTDHMVDDMQSGFYGRIDGRGVLHAHADKSVILNVRILWAYSAAARRFSGRGYAEMASRAYEYIARYFADSRYGGLFWSVDYLGIPVQTKKQIYAQAFAVYAFSEYYLLTNDTRALEMASTIFGLIEKYSFDNEHGGYLEAFNRTWRLLDDVRLSDKDQNALKSMHTHLHLLEAYTNLSRVLPEARGALTELIRLFLDKFIRPEGHLHLFFSRDWQSQSQVVSFGHDIECSWLLVEAADVAGDDGLRKEVSVVAVRMAHAVLAEGCDTDGALFYEMDPDGQHDTDKHWWPQAEAVIGFWNAWELSHESHFRDASLRVWEFVRTILRDVSKGEWLWRVSRDGTPVGREDKAGPWKAPYHNSRMCLEMLRRISQ